ncbi:Membrane-associated phosphatidylinositol transfer protein 2, partial [Biomphalaria pfeifferi]
MNITYLILDHSTRLAERTKLFVRVSKIRTLSTALFLPSFCSLTSLRISESTARCWISESTVFVSKVGDLDYSKMLIKEYRISLPMSVEEYRIAQLYMIQ